MAEGQAIPLYLPSLEKKTKHCHMFDSEYCQLSINAISYCYKSNIIFNPRQNYHYICHLIY